MTPKQAEKMARIESKLVDVFLEEADPDQWAKVNPEDGPKVQQIARGDRYWQCKVANQTMALLTRITAYRAKLDELLENGKTPLDDDAKHAADMKAAEKKVNARLSLVKKRAC